MAGNERYSLGQEIFEDLIGRNKFTLLLLALIVVTALATVWITAQTRLLTAEQGKLVKANRKLENQYIHLQLEENSASRENRISAFATKAELQSIKKEQEVILLEKK